MTLSAVVTGTLSEVKDGTFIARTEAIARQEHMTPIAMRVASGRIHVLLGPSPSAN